MQKILTTVTLLRFSKDILRFGNEFKAIKAKKQSTKNR